jgi:hypothetical protein
VRGQAFGGTVKGGVIDVMCVASSMVVGASTEGRACTVGGTVVGGAVVGGREYRQVAGREHPCIDIHEWNRHCRGYHRRT